MIYIFMTGISFAIDLERLVVLSYWSENMLMIFPWIGGFVL